MPGIIMVLLYKKEKADETDISTYIFTQIPREILCFLFSFIYMFTILKSLQFFYLRMKIYKEDENKIRINYIHNKIGENI